MIIREESEIKDLRQKFVNCVDFISENVTSLNTSNNDADNKENESGDIDMKRFENKLKKLNRQFPIKIIDELQN